MSRAEMTEQRRRLPELTPMRARLRRTHRTLPRLGPIPARVMVRSTRRPMAIRAPKPPAEVRAATGRLQLRLRLRVRRRLHLRRRMRRLRTVEKRLQRPTRRATPMPRIVPPTRPTRTAKTSATPMRCDVREKGEAPSNSVASRQQVSARGGKRLKTVRTARVSVTCSTARVTSSKIPPAAMPLGWWCVNRGRRGVPCGSRRPRPC